MVSSVDHGAVERAGDPALAVILAHGDERHERALEPVGAICEDADDIAGLVGDQQVMPVEVGAHAQSSAGPQAARKAATSRRTRSWADSSTV